MTRYSWMALLAGLVALPAWAQQTQPLNCQGSFMGYQAEVQGQRTFVPINQLGEGKVGFSGVLRTPAGTGRMMYGGYTRLAPFDGVLDSPQGQWPISVLDATGGLGNEMMIYDASRITMGAPDLLGHLICQ